MPVLLCILLVMTTISANARTGDPVAKRLLLGMRPLDSELPPNGEARYWMGITNSSKEPVVVCIQAAFYSVVCHSEQSIEGSVVPASAHSCHSTRAYRLLLPGETLFTLADVRAPKECLGPARLSLNASVSVESAQTVGKGTTEDHEVVKEILVGRLRRHAP
jgi:hypothetical protein